MRVYHTLKTEYLTCKSTGDSLFQIFWISNCLEVGFRIWVLGFWIEDLSLKSFLLCGSTSCLELECLHILLPNYKLVSSKMNSMKCIVNWIPLNTHNRPELNPALKTFLCVALSHVYRKSTLMNIYRLRVLWATQDPQPKILNPKS